MSRDYQKLVDERIKWTLDGLKFINPRSISRLKIKGEICDNIGTAAGYAIWETRTVQFNKQLLIDHTDEMIKTIVPHEVCHVIDGLYFAPVIHHNKNWRRLMKILGLPTSPYHRLNCDSIPQKDPDVYVYRCMCQHGYKHIVNGRMHQIRQQREIICKQCETPVQFSHVRELRIGQNDAAFERNHHNPPANQGHQRQAGVSSSKRKK